jgi:hypothetical protein
MRAILGVFSAWRQLGGVLLREVYDGIVEFVCSAIETFEAEFLVTAVAPISAAQVQVLDAQD